MSIKTSCCCGKHGNGKDIIVGFTFDATNKDLYPNLGKLSKHKFWHDFDAFHDYCKTTQRSNKQWT